MNTMCDMFGNLQGYKKDELRRLFGGELNWKNTFDNLSPEKKIQMGEIVFAVPVKNVRLEWYQSENGWELPIIVGEPLNILGYQYYISACTYCSQDLRFRKTAIGTQFYFRSGHVVGSNWLTLSRAAETCACNYCGRQNKLPAIVSFFMIEE